MKILFITSYSGMYGANRSLFDLICDLKNKGVNAIVLVSGQKGELGRQLERIGVECIESPFSPIVISKNTKFLMLRKITRRIMRYYGYVKAWQIIQGKKLSFDIVHSNTIIAEIGCYLSKKMKVPHVWHIREFPFEGYNLVNVLSRRELHSRMQKSHMVAISKAIKNRYSKDYVLDSISVVYNKISICLPYEKKYFCDGVVRFVVVGEVCENKRQKDIFRACARLISKGITNFQLLVVGGGDEKYISELYEFIEMNKLENTIIMKGYSNNVNDILQKCDVGILASASEGFGRSLVEYMAHYMLPIGSNTGGIPEAIEDVGLLYETGNVECLANHMEKCIFNKQIIASNGHRAREYAEKYGTNRCSEQMMEIYDKVIKYYDVRRRY